jgi:hypothetical protein
MAGWYAVPAQAKLMTYPTFGQRPDASERDLTGTIRMDLNGSRNVSNRNETPRTPTHVGRRALFPPVVTGRKAWSLATVGLPLYRL